jgi:uncharacterized membrane protein SpoIIM required for sporulation/ABC-type transport system involved in multi-copper enzyme maturation permease subunit
MTIDLKPALVVAWREIRDMFRDWRVVFPIVGLTVFFPFLMNFTARQVVGYVQQYGANLLATRFIPFLLMIVGFFPISVSLVIALESFAGESERHSIEPLLSSPLTDWQLYLGKLLAALVPPILASMLGITVYYVGVNRSVGWTAAPLFLLQIILLTAVQALVMVSGAVVVSTQTTSVRAANLLASFIIIPMSLLIQGEAVVMLWGSDEILWWIILGEVLISVLLVRAGIAHFNREELLGRELDVLNLRRSWSVFKKAFVGEAHSLKEWMKYEIPGTLKKTTIPLVFSLLLLPVGLWMGFYLSEKLYVAPEILNLDQIMKMNAGIASGLRESGFISPGAVVYIWFHNLRVVLLATAAGIFSFGVLGVFILLTPLALLGFLAQTAVAAGINRWSFLAAFTLPHGLLEFPAMIVTCALILRVGATMVTPAKHQSISDSWLSALADWLKIVLLVVMPLFLIAAVIEVFVTPYTISFFLTR